MPATKVLVVGASQGVGIELVNLLAARGVEVRALARHRVRTRRPGVTSIEGDARNIADIARALDSCDAVAVTLGLATRNPLTLLSGGGATPPDICSKGTAVVIAEMKARGVDRLVALSADGVGDSGKDVPLPARLIAQTVLARAMADKTRMEAAVRASGLRWTIVRPVGLSDRRGSGRVFVSPDGRSRSLFVPRADVAGVIADALTADRYLHAAVTVSERGD